VRVLLLLALGCGSAVGQSTLRDYLKLTDTQAAAIGKLDSGLFDFVSAKELRAKQVNLELTAELAKASPDARELGVRYVELGSIAREEAAQRTAARGQIAALLTPAQMELLQALSAAAVQQGLVTDAQCAGLLEAPQPPTFAFRSGDFSIIGTVPVASFVGVLSPFPATSCLAQFPISVREYLNLTDAQVAGILGIRMAYNDLNARKQNRIADVQVEIRDETAKAVPDPVALGQRYAELNSISNETQQGDVEARDAAAKLLTAAQGTKLQMLKDAIPLEGFEREAESCNLVAPLAGIAGVYTISGRVSCP